jgi:hypothetical protein
MDDPTIRSKSLHRVRALANTLNQKRKEEKNLAATRPPRKLLDLLPPTNEIAQTLQLYWSSMEYTYRVLHAPTFWVKYRAFSKDPSSASEAFAATLLLIVASVRCLGPTRETSYRGLSSVGRDEAMASIKACEGWLLGQSRKQLPMELLQIRVLLYVAKRANGLHVKRGWEEATALVTFAVGMGLHRNASLLYKGCRGEGAGANLQTSQYEKEMRRRIWTTIIELELQAAFDRGMFTMSLLSTDCGAPSNIDDADLVESSEELAPSKSVESFTPCSFLSLSGRSFSLRSAISQAINDPHKQISYDEMLSYHNMIMEDLDTMPPWVRSNRRTNTTTTPATMPALLLDIQLRQYLIILHLPFARHADVDPRYRFSRTVCLNAANTILEFHSKLIATGNYTLNLLREDVFRSALAMCHSIMSWNATQGQTPFGLSHTVLTK